RWLPGFDGEIHPARGHPPARPDRPGSAALGVRSSFGNRLLCRFCAGFLAPWPFGKQAHLWLDTSANVSRLIGGKEFAILGGHLQLEPLLADLVADRRNDLQRIRVAADPGVDATHLARRAAGGFLVGTPALLSSVHSGLEIYPVAISVLLPRRCDHFLDLSADSPALAADSGPLADGYNGRDLHLEILNLLQADGYPMIAVAEFLLHRHFAATFSALRLAQVLLFLESRGKCEVRKVSQPAFTSIGSATRT